MAGRRGRDGRTAEPAGAAADSQATDRAQAQIWRSEIVKARIRLAEPRLAPAQRQALWQAVDFREGCLRLLCADFGAELEKIDREIEAELRPASR